MSDANISPLRPDTDRGLNDRFFEPVSEAFRSGTATRKCPKLDDLEFVRLAVTRVLHETSSGRDFLQTHAIPEVPQLTRHSYFKNLGSSRRLKLIGDIDTAMRDAFLPRLRSADDRLAVFGPELDRWEVWAGDGHAMKHATHDPRNASDSHSASRGIYRLDLRTGWVGFMDLQRPTDKASEHEITTLKRVAKDTLRCGAGKGRSTLWVYDSAIVDFRFAYDIKQSRSVYVLTDWKANLKPMTVIPREVDRADPVNALVLADETVYFDNHPGVWRRITALKPDTGESHVSLTNQMTLRPGTLNQLRRMRWNIEKAFNEQECKLGEDKAWTADENGKRIQALAICIACNLLRIFHDKIRREEGITDAKVEKAWKDKLGRRAKELLALGREVPVKLYLSLRRPTEASLQFIRWLRIELLRASCYREALARLRPLMEKYL